MSAVGNSKKQNPAGGPGFASKQTIDGGLHGDGSPSRIASSNAPDPVGLLSRLDRVRKAGSGWSARCPAHEDRSASLSVSTGTDGRLLVHCFAGCAIGDVLGAIGMTVSDLFVHRLRDASPEARREARRLAIQADWSAALGVLEREAGVVLIAGLDLANGKSLEPNDHGRLTLAIERISAARRVLAGGRYD